MTDVARAWLTADEVHDLTARVRWSAQRRALAAMGVPFRPNAAGRPLVEAAAVLRYRERPARKPPTPNWSAINGTSAHS